MTNLRFIWEAIYLFSYIQFSVKVVSDILSLCIFQVVAKTSIYLTGIYNLIQRNTDRKGNLCSNLQGGVFKKTIGN